MIRYSYLAALSLLSMTTYANTTIQNANNQAFVDGQYGHDKWTYSSNHPGDAGAPLYNSHADRAGGFVGITQTVGALYSQLTLGTLHSSIHYSDAGIIPPSINDGSANTLTVAAKLGYNLTPCSPLGITPYVLGAYANTQLNTGGFSTNFVPATFGGTTFITQSFYFGLGLLNQWAVTPRWVLSTDILFGTQSQPNVGGYVNNFNNQPGAVTTYQHWNLSNNTFWQAGLGSDYLVTKHIHLRTNVNYSENQLGRKNSPTTGYYPSQETRGWNVSAGLGYSLADFTWPQRNAIGNCQAAILAVNNQASLQLGYLNQHFHGGTTLNTFNQTTNVPTIGLTFNKTWNAIYTQLAVREGVGVQSYETQNTFYDVMGKLGYQFEHIQNMNFIPYAVLGYHRWLQNVRGNASSLGIINNIPTTFYINGKIETFQHSWYGLGLLAQFALSPQWVLNIDGNVGRTFDATMQGWSPVFQPLNLSYTLGNAYSQMIKVGVDYSPLVNWHLQGNVGYWHVDYHRSHANAVGISTLADSTRQVDVTLGLGYSFA